MENEKMPGAFPDSGEQKTVSAGDVAAVGEKRRGCSPLLFVFLGLVLGVGIKLFCLDLLNVSGSSMEPAVKDGSRVTVNKLAYGLVRPFGEDLLVQWAEPAAGEMVLYFYNDRAVIKRCVAVAGDRLDFSTDFGYSLVVNEKNIPLTESQYQRLKHNRQVPPGMILAVGDNYADSVDSRDYGFVSVNNILGRIVGHE